VEVSERNIQIESGESRFETKSEQTKKLKRRGEKLVREWGAGSGERGAGISSPNFLEF
jgi:hypothetical protein